MNEFTQWQIEGEFVPRYIYEARRIITHFLNFIGEVPPSEVTKDHILDFFKNWERDTLQGRVIGFQPGRNRSHYRTHINQFLKFCGNNVIETMRWKDPKDVRINVRWLDSAQVSALLDLEMDPREAMIIHLGLGMGMRREEMSKIRVQDIDVPNEWISVLGKGMKIRSIPFSPDTPMILEKWMEERENILARYPQDTPWLLIRLKGPNKNIICRSGMDRILKKISQRAGFHFSFHDLRRTWARQGWEYGVPVETLATILGHRDTRETLRYIGAPVDNLRSALKTIYEKRMEDIIRQ